MRAEVVRERSASLVPAPLHTIEARQQFHEHVCNVFRRLDIVVNPAAACLYWSVATVIAAKEMGLFDLGWDVQLQGGSAQWVRSDEDKDDNAFGYIWEPDSDVTRLKLAQGLMPEMHVWCASARHGVLFDMTTGFQPRQCLDMLGKHWEIEPPPPFAIFHVTKPPPGMFYVPDPGATALAYQFADIFFKMRRSACVYDACVPPEEQS